MINLKITKISFSFVLTTNCLIVDTLVKDVHNTLLKTMMSFLPGLIQATIISVCLDCSPALTIVGHLEQPIANGRPRK